MSLSEQRSAPYPVITVQGQLPYEQLGITDAHNHTWINPVPGADPSAPVLNQFDPILRELIEYYEKGGWTLLDCQPQGCGRMSELYHFIGGGAGLASLPSEIQAQLKEKGIRETARKQMLGGNIARRLAGLN